MAEQQPHRILLLSHARTASHLLERMLSKQPNVAYSFHAFVAARPLQEQLVRSGSLAEWPAAEREALKNAWQDALPKYLGDFAKAREEGKIAFHHMHPHFSLYPELAATYTFNEQFEHPDWSYWQPHSTTGPPTESYTSPNVLPDDALLQSGDRVVFLIRHPALMVPSIYRTICETRGYVRNNMVFSSTLRWSRLLYDWYLEKGPAKGVHPIVVDADDYMADTDKSFMTLLCNKLGLDPEAVVYTWPKDTKESLEVYPEPIREMVGTIKKTLMGSEGLVRGNTAVDFDMAQAEHKWTQTWGEKGAAEIKELVGRTMPEYEYMRAQRLQVDVVGLG